MHVTSGNLLNGGTKSCGCLKNESRNSIEEYLEAIKQIQNETNELPYIDEIADVLGLHTANVRHNIDKYNLWKYINKTFRSKPEREIANIIGVDKIVTSNRTILNGQELDIYIPEKKIAIEFNGTYWHSADKLNKYYHQQKTIECAKQGIRLIHIFEYEWNDPIKREKIEKYLLNIIDNKDNSQIINIDDTEVKLINKEQAQTFLNKYHLQDSDSSSINIGCFYEDKLTGVITLNRNNLDSENTYQLVRLCWRDDVKVIGGTEKLFKYFTTNYNPQSIITYTDISKFTGNVYTRLGFKPIGPNPITEPNYVWVNKISNEVINSSQTMKHKLIEKGLGTEDQTENEIMENLGFLKIYDCGNIKLEYKI